MATAPSSCQTGNAGILLLTVKIMRQSMNANDEKWLADPEIWTALSVMIYTEVAE